MDSASFFRDKSLGADSPISVSASLVMHLLQFSLFISNQKILMFLYDVYLFLNQNIV